MTIIRDDRTDKENDHHSEDKSTKLNNHLVELLEGLNNRKSRIDEQVKFLSSLPKILPFEPLPPEPSNVSRKTWERWWSEHDRIEQEADLFREDEFALMKKVAMSKTTNMSREDTDLVGLTLGTLEAFSKLEHLLRSRRKQLQILDLRIKWDQQTSKVWQDLAELETQLPILLSKIRWTPPSTPCNSPPFPQRPTTLPSSHPCPSSSSHSTRNSLSRSLQSRKELTDFRHKSQPFSSLDVTAVPQSSTNVEQTNINRPSSQGGNPSIGVCLIGSSVTGLPSQLPHSESFPRFRNTISCIRTTSAPAYDNSYTTSVTIPSSYSSAQSRAMRIQSLALQLSSISTKFHTLNRSIVPTSTTIDKLIDSGLHVPEIFLDLQDKLEAAVRSLQPTETGKFCVALMEQHKEADDIWFNLFHLGLEIESSKREIDCLLVAAQIDPLRLVKFRCEFDRLEKKYDTQNLRTQLRILPIHSNYPDQQEFNQILMENLRKGSKQVRNDLDRLDETLKVYQFATEALEESKALRSSMEASRHKLLTSIEAIETLNQAHPQRAWLMNGPGCLALNEKDKEYENEWGKIMIGMKENLLAAANLLETAQVTLKKLNAPGGDPNVRSNFRQVTDVLKKSVDQANQISTNKEESVKKLSKIRTIWGKIIETQSEVGRLRDQLLLDAYRDKWRMRKVSTTSPVISSEESDCMFERSTRNTSPRGFPSLEELRRPAAPPINLFHTHEEISNYISQSLQPLVDSTLADLARQNQNHAVHQHVVHKLEELRSVQLPGVVKLEKTTELIRSQACQVRKVESEYDAKVIEGGRWMKKVQDLIGVELEHTYEEIEKPLGPMDSEARLVEDSSQTQTLVQLTNFLYTIDQFTNSLPNRIPFIAASHSDDLVMQNGRVVLHCRAHDDSVRAHLNGLSMYLMGLKNQISNEAILFGWINSTHVKKFKQAVDDVGKEIETTDMKLQTFKANIQRLQNLIESNVYEPFLTDDQLEETLNKPLQELAAVLDEIESQLSQSASVHLEAFITSCPSSSSSGAFKPDQFILPKQMSHHQLQALYNQTRRELENIHLLANKFKNETNLRRKNEVSWREGWTQSINESSIDCANLAAEILMLESQITQLGEELVDWDLNQFQALGKAKLPDVDDPIPGYLEQLMLYESRLAGFKAALESAKDRIDLVHQRATSVKLDIEDRLPVFIHLTADLFPLLAQLKCQWATSHDIGLQISLSTGRLKQDVESFLEEYGRRLEWKDQCLNITGEGLQYVDDLLVEFDENFDQFSRCWRSLDEGETLEAAGQAFGKLLDFSRSLNSYRSTDLCLIQSKVHAAQTKLSAIRKAIDDVRGENVPHAYLSKANAEVERRTQELRKRIVNLEAAEKDLLTLLCRVNYKQQSCLDDTAEIDIILTHYETERARLSDWGRNDLDRFIDSVQTEGEQIGQLIACTELRPLQGPTASWLQSLSKSAISRKTLADICSNMKDEVKGIDDLVKSALQITRRIEILDGTQGQLAQTIIILQRTLPGQCSKCLEEILNQRPSQVQNNGPDRFEAASSKLEDNHSTLRTLNCSLEARLDNAKENLRIIQDEITKVDVLSSLCDRLNQLDLDGFVDLEADSQYSPLPNQDGLEHVLDVLGEIENEVKQMSDPVLVHTRLKDTLNLLEDQKHKAGIMSQLAIFKSAISDCDQTFSALIDILDVRRTQTTEAKVKDLTKSATAAFDALLKVSENIKADTRVEYQVSRSRHTWEELESIVRENLSEQQKDLRRSTNRANNPLSKSTRLPLPNRSRSRLANVSDTPSSANSSPSCLIPRLKHSSHHAMNQFESPTVSDFPGGLNKSHSFMITRRNAQPSPESFHSRLSKAIPHSESNSPLVPARSISRQSEGKNSSSMKSNASFRERHRLHSIQGTPTRPAAKLLANRTAANPNITPTLYKPQANRNIDKLVGNVVNRLARNQFRVHVAPADGWEDNSGMYWIGEKIYFCRILRSQTVMVRIGGGWCELSAFLMEHLRLTSPNNTPPQIQYRTGGGSEGVTSSEHARRASTSHSPLLPSSTISSHGSCDSSPRNTHAVNYGKLTDSSTSTPSSSTATVLITTPQEVRTNHGPSSNERSHLTQSTSQPNSFLSTPTETIQMFLRKAENRSYLTNNYIITPPHDGVTTSDSMLKINRPSYSTVPSSKLDPSALPPSLSHNTNTNSTNLNVSNTGSSKNSPLPLWKP